MPFWCQTRPETVHPKMDGYKKLEMLQEVGLHHMSFGMEHGDEEFRAKVIDRRYSNDSAIRAMRVPADLGIPFTVNNIIGFPDETYDLAMKTVEINRHFDSHNVSVSTFAPYRGTVLRTLAVKRGYLDDDFITPANYGRTVLKMPEFSADEIYGLQRTFVMYAKFPKTRWPEIRQAESLTGAGDEVWKRLRDEFMATYFRDPEPRIDRVNETV